MTTGMKYAIPQASLARKPRASGLGSKGEEWASQVEHIWGEVNWIVYIYTLYHLDLFIPIYVWILC